MHKLVLTFFLMPGEFDDLLSSSETRSESEPVEEIAREFCSGNSTSVTNGSASNSHNSVLMMIENLTLLTPSNAALIRELSLEIHEKEHLLVISFTSCLKVSLLC